MCRVPCEARQVGLTLKSYASSLAWYTRNHGFCVHSHSFACCDSSLHCARTSLDATIAFWLAIAQSKGEFWTNRMTNDHRICRDCSAKLSADDTLCPSCGCPRDSEAKRSFVVPIAVASLVVAATVVGIVVTQDKVESPDDTPPEHYHRAQQLAESKPARPVESADLSRTNILAAFSADGTTSAWGSDRHVLMANVGQEQKPTVLEAHHASITAIAFSPSGAFLVTGDADGVVNVWNLARATVQRVLSTHHDSITAVVFSRDGTMIATASQDGTLRLWDFATGGELIVIDGHHAPVSAIAFHLGKRQIVTAGEDHTIRLWDLETGREWKQFEASNRRITRLLFSADQETLVSLDEDNLLHLWNAESGEQRLKVQLDCTPLALSLSLDGSKIATALFDLTVVTWDTTTGKPLTRERVEEAVVYLSYDGESNKFVWSRTSSEFLLNVGATRLVEEAVTASKVAERWMAEIQIPDDGTISLFAAEPKVANPTSISFDDQGRLFVAESFRADSELTMGMAGRDFWLHDDLANQTTADRQQMYEKWADKTKGGMAAHTRFSDRVRRLSDAGATVFSKGYNTPLTGTATGVLAHDGKVYLGCIPNLWQLTDRDDDGHADDRTSLHEGFGVCASLAHGLHGLIIGPDGKLYFSVGDRGYHIETQEGKTLHNPGRGAIFRCNLDGSELEEYAVGFRNTQDMAFDQFGNLITCDNNADAGDKARLIYVVKGGDYGWNQAYETIEGDVKAGPWHLDKLWHTRTEGQSASVIPPIAHLSTGPSGMTFDPGVGLPPRFRNHFFVCDYIYRRDISGVLSFDLKPDRAGFKLGASNMVLSNVLATDVEFGYDGKMYVSDWVHGRGSSGIGRIYAVEFPAAFQNGLAKLFADGFRHRSIDELTHLLSHNDRRVRHRAQLALAELGPKSIDALKSVSAGDKNQLARIHAIWALGAISREDAAAVFPLTKLLLDTDHEVRAQVAKTVGESKHTESADELLPLLKDPQPRVQYFAAMALGDLQHKPAIESIVGLARKNDDQDFFLRHAAIYALYKIGDADAIYRFANDASSAVRMTVLLALRRFGDERIREFLDDESPQIVVEAARAIHDIPIQAAYPSLAALIDQDLRSLQDFGSLTRRVINANFRLGNVSNATALVHFAANPENDLAMRIEATSALGDWQSPSPRDRVLGVIRPLPHRDLATIRDAIVTPLTQLVEQTDGELQREAIQFAGSLKIPTVHTMILGWISDETKSVPTRLAALRQFAKIENNRDKAVESGLAADHPLLRAEAVRLLTATHPERALDELRQALERDSIAERQQALATLSKIQLVEADNLLAKWLDRLLDDEVPVALRVDVIEAAAARDDALVADKLRTYFSRHDDDLDAWRRTTISQGVSVERGRAIFHDRAKTQCVRCHKIEGQGGVVGPDLTKIGSKHPREYLVESLLAPNAVIAKGFEGVRIITVEGKIYTGILKSEDEQSFHIVEASGEQRSIAKADIEERSKGKSVMPTDLTNRLALIELRDLVEFLANLK